MTFSEWWQIFLKENQSTWYPGELAAKAAWEAAWYRSRIELMLDLALERDVWQKGNVLDIWDLITKLSFPVRQEDTPCSTGSPTN